MQIFVKNFFPFHFNIFTYSLVLRHRYLCMCVLMKSRAIQQPFIISTSLPASNNFTRQLLPNYYYLVRIRISLIPVSRLTNDFTGSHESPFRNRSTRTYNTQALNMGLEFSRDRGGGGAAFFVFRLGTDFTRLPCNRLNVFQAS